jgi:hypothetical protein
VAVFYNNLESLNERAALLSSICTLRDIKDFINAGFLFSSPSIFENAHRKNKNKEFKPANVSDKVVAYHEKQAMEKKSFFCKVLRWALSEPNFFQNSNIPLLRRGFSLSFFLTHSPQTKKNQGCT